MEMENIIFIVICGAVILTGAIGVVYQVYRITMLDAEARGLKHPKFWGFFAMSGNNSGGLIMYLIGRKKYPIISMTESNKKEIQTRKKSAGAGLIFLAAGAVGFMLCITLL